APPAPRTPPHWSITGAQANGLNIPDPNYTLPPINATSQTWNSTTRSVEQPGTYNADPHLSGGAGCYFLAAGVYNFKGGLTQLGGFISNELRPPDEPNLTSTTSALTGTITSIPVVALQVAVPGNSTVTVGGQRRAQRQRSGLACLLRARKRALDVQDGDPGQQRQHQGVRDHRSGGGRFQGLPRHERDLHRADLLHAHRYRQLKRDDQLLSDGPAVAAGRTATAAGEHAPQHKSRGGDAAPR